MSDHRSTSGRKIQLAVGAGALALVTFVGGYAVGNAGHSGTGMTQVGRGGGQPPSGATGEAPSGAAGTAGGSTLDS
ncbi:MAG: hypothetical protein JWQ70_250 [Aeromicrobium sp.]|nr:hypothetical protein [Aeromicrobium sp.]